MVRTREYINRDAGQTKMAYFGDGRKIEPSVNECVDTDWKYCGMKRRCFESCSMAENTEKETVLREMNRYGGKNSSNVMVIEIVL